jgi:dienelactone hydrolase
MTITRRFALLGPATVALGAAAFSSTPARAAMKTESIDYSHGNTKLKAYVAYDDSVTGKRPAIFMVHARNGLTDFAKQQAEEWSKLGYYVFATDMFGMLPKNLEEITAQTDMFRKDRTFMNARAQAGFDALAKQALVDTSRIALIGYCFGGTVGVEFGSTGAPLVANVAIHGSFGGHASGWAKNAKGMFLILHGAEDPNYPVEFRPCDRRAESCEDAVRSRALRRHGARLLTTEEQGGRAGHHPGQSDHRAHAQGAVRGLNARVLSTRAGVIDDIQRNHTGGAGTAHPLELASPTAARFSLRFLYEQ